VGRPFSEGLSEPFFVPEDHAAELSSCRKQQRSLPEGVPAGADSCTAWPPGGLLERAFSFFGAIVLNLAVGLADPSGPFRVNYRVVQ